MHRTSIAAGLIALVVGFALAGCASSRSGVPAHDAQAAFWGALEDECGRAFEGRIVEDSTASPDFAGKRLVMHVRRCADGRILVPFHVGEDRSRTWVFTVTETGLRLKHDHRHEDGSEDDLTQYGGDTRGPGTATVQEFFADAHTAAVLPAAATNVWTVEIVPGRMYAYGLRREGTDRRFRVEFDLTRPVPVPPAPWGHEGE
jgi:hypothetical protein